MAEEFARPRIVVGVDGSEPSKLALRWAGVLSRAMGGAHIEAVSAWRVPTSYGWSYAPDNWNPEGDDERALRAAVDEVFGAERPPNLDLIAREGVAAKVLLDQSKGAAMLIVGSRGHGGFAGLLLGSVSMACAEHATCPVLIAHGDAVPAFPG